MARFNFVLLLVSVLGGCGSVGPDYVRPDVDVPGGWRIEYEGAAKLANVPWWEQLQDPTFNELIQTALRENKDLQIAASRVKQFAARVGVNRSAGFPQLSFESSATRDRFSLETAVPLRSDVARTNNAFEATLNASWEIDLWGRIRRANEAALADLLSAEEGRRAVILTLVTTVANSYIELLNLKKQLEIAGETLRSREESLQLFERKLKGGAISELELAQVRSEYEHAAAQIPSLERRIALLENSLSVLLGHNPGPILHKSTLDDLTLPPVPAGIPSDILTRRPDILQAEQALVAANARIGVTKAQYLPTFSLTGLLGLSSSEVSNFLQSTANHGSIGGQFLGPLFTGGRREAEIEEAIALREQALIQYLSNIQTAVREVDDALVSSQKYREELEVHDRRVTALKDYTRLANQRFNDGYTSYMEVLDAERSLFTAQLEYIQIKSNVYNALVDIYKAMGGGWITLADQLDRRGSEHTPNPATTASPDTTLYTLVVDPYADFATFAFGQYSDNCEKIQQLGEHTGFPGQFAAPTTDHLSTSSKLNIQYPWH